MTAALVLMLGALAAGGLTAALLKAVLRHPGALPLDVANRRSLHSGAVPRIGGACMVIAVAVSQLTTASLLRGQIELPVAVWLPALALAGVSFADDWRSLPVGLRLAAHFAAAAVAVIPLDMPLLSAGLLAIGVVWMTNLYNFMDGSDGLAGSMAAVGFAAYAVVAWPQSPALAGCCAATAAAAVAFLFFNWAPATVFMGDAGSVPLGFLAGALGLLGWHQAIWPSWFPLLVFMPFIADATVTLGRRLMARERVWQAHRDHYYQRLVRLGCSHRRLAVWAGLLMVACSATAIVLLRATAEAQTGVLILCGIVVAVAMVRIELRWQRAGGDFDNPG